MIEFAVPLDQFPRTKGLRLELSRFPNPRDIRDPEANGSVSLAAAREPLREFSSRQWEDNVNDNQVNGSGDDLSEQSCPLLQVEDIHAATGNEPSVAEAASLRTDFSSVGPDAALRVRPFSFSRSPQVFHLIALRTAERLPPHSDQKCTTIGRNSGLVANHSRIYYFDQSGYHPGVWPRMGAWVVGIVVAHQCHSPNSSAGR